jgi:hypothetical protein
MHFLSDDYFTFGTKDDNITAVYRTCDGERLCTVDTRTFYFIRKSISPERIDPTVVGIYDVISQKVFKPNIKTLMHFGARSLIIGPTTDLFLLE